MYNSRVWKERARGFTLIELLVVIAIIALLAAILFPVFARARENARRSTCQSNLKQMSLGVLQYLQDYDEFFPVLENGCSIPSQTCSGSYGWPTLIMPYVKSSQIFVCPSDTRKPVSIPVTCSYSVNEYLGCASTALGTAATKLSAVQQSSQVIMWTEDGQNSTGWDQIAITNYETTFNGDLPQTGNASTSPNTGHFGGQNWAFVDGHVKWLKMYNLGNQTQNGISWLTNYAGP